MDPFPELLGVLIFTMEFPFYPNHHYCTYFSYPLIDLLTSYTVLLSLLEENKQANCQAALTHMRAHNWFARICTHTQT